MKSIFGILCLLVASSSMAGADKNFKMDSEITDGESSAIAFCRIQENPGIAIGMHLGVNCDEGSNQRCNAFEVLAAHDFLYDAYPIGVSSLSNVDSNLPTFKMDYLDSKSLLAMKVVSRSSIKKMKVDGDVELKFTMKVKVESNNISPISKIEAKDILKISENKRNVMNKSISDLRAGASLTLSCVGAQF